MQAVLDLPPAARVEAVLSWAPTQPVGLADEKPPALWSKTIRACATCWASSCGAGLALCGSLSTGAGAGGDQHGALADLVLMDIMLPGIDGLELLEPLRAHGAGAACR